MIRCNKDMDGKENACPACGAASRESGKAGAGSGHSAALPQRPEHAEKSGRRLRPLSAFLLKIFAAAAMLVLAAMSVTTGSFAKAADARDAAQANHVAAEDVVWEMK